MSIPTLLSGAGTGGGRAFRLALLFMLELPHPRNMEVEAKPQSFCIDGHSWLWERYAMRTTIDIPEPLYRKAKLRAVERRTSLKALVLKALEQELLPEPLAPSEVPYFARRKLLPEFKKLMESGALRPRPGDRDVTDLISEDRDREIS